jgi:hypothetical protein
LRCAKSILTFFRSFIEMTYCSVLAMSRATWRASSCSSRVILRATAFGQHFALEGQAWHTSFSARYRAVLLPVGPRFAFDPQADWPEPDMSLLSPVRPPAPILSDAIINWIYGPWAEWLRTAAAAKGAPFDYVALGLLTTTSALIGNARWSAPGPDWQEPPILWGMLVGEPSAGKSPALDAVMARLSEIENVLSDDYRTALATWEANNELAAMSAAEWKKSAKEAIAAGKQAPPKPPTADAGAPPIRRRLRVSDVTTEKMAELLSQTSRGVLMYRDELSGWLGGMDRYSNGGDRPFWIEAYGGRSFTVDRKSTPDPIVVDRLSVAVIGGTQPDRLNSQLVKGDDDGLLSRFLVVFPDPVPISRPTCAIDTVRLREAFNRVRSLAPAIDLNGKDCPVMLGFNEAALSRLYEFRVTCRAWEAQAHGSYKSHLGKLHGHVVRLSCVLAHLDWAANPFASAPTEISESIVERAIHLVGDYFRLHAYRAYGCMQDAPEVRSARRLASLIVEDALGSVKVRDIQRRRLSDLRTAREIKIALEVLERFEWVRHTVESTAGRPSEFWIVNPRLGAALKRSAANPVTEDFPTLLSPSVDMSTGDSPITSLPGMERL